MSFSSSNTKYLIILICYLGALSLLDAKKVTLSELLINYEQGNLKFCRENIKEVAEKNPGNSNILYVRGCIEENGEQSVAYFKEMLAKNKKSTKSALAEQKIADYEKIKKMLNGNLSMGSSIQQVVKTDLLSSLIKPATKDKQRESEPVKTIATGAERKLSQTADDGQLYFIQLGAYSSEKNARMDIKKYALYKPFVKEAEIRGKKLFLILSGAYESAAEAEKIAERIRKLFKIEPLVKEF